MSNMRAYVYILHYHAKIAHAQHYTGWTVDIEARLKKHMAGTGGRLPAAFAAKGYIPVLGRVWECATTNEARSLEWKVKHKWKNASKRYCKICRGLNETKD